MQQVIGPKEWSVGIIVLVDDNDIDRMITQKLLQKAGFTGQVVSLDSAQAALQYLQSCSETGQYPFLILLDMSMPLLSGVDFLERCAQDKYLNGHPVNITLLTSSSYPADLQKAQQYGVKYLDKPLNAEKLKLLLQGLPTAFTS
jgi:CheY-like chemotaxis protein